jgi:5-methylcytosine-specific restriction endonuclease McrA
VCGKQFDTAYAKARTCSIACHDVLFARAKKQAAHRRRVRLRGGNAERFEAIEIYERDGWRCQICGGPVNRNAVCPHPLSPSLDHIVPVARGGDHTRLNVQCAHFICNSRKSDTVAGAQLRLIG